MFGVHVDGWTYRFVAGALTYTHFTGNDLWWTAFPGLVDTPVNIQSWEASFV
jgi:hypothetical protein